MNVKFIVDTVKIENKDKNDNLIYDYKTVIKLKNFDNNHSVIHRYTEFLTLYRNRKPNTIKKRAGYITQFLNLE